MSATAAFFLFLPMGALAGVSHLVLLSLQVHALLGSGRSRWLPLRHLVMPTALAIAVSFGPAALTATLIGFLASRTWVLRYPERFV